MRRSWIGVLVAAFLVVGVAVPAQAQLGEFAAGAKVGTLGLGVEMTAGITPYLNGRLGLNGFTISYEGEESGVDYDIDMDLFTVGLLLDYHPFEKSGWRATAGLMINQNGADMDGDLDDNEYYDIGDNAKDNRGYTGQEIGDLSGDLDFNDIAPYLGIGYGNAVDQEGNWQFSFDLGVLFQGSADLGYKAEGTTLTGNDLDTFRNDLERERKDLEDDLDKFEFYPVIAVGVTYRF